MTHALDNPLLQDWDTPYGLPPFAAVRPAHFLPAFELAWQRHLAEVDAIGAAEAAPTLANSVAAFDASGRLLGRIASLFYTLAASATSPELQAVERELAPRMAAQRSAIAMHAALFRRIDAVHEALEATTLPEEDRRLVERIHLDFVRAGARLAPAAQQRYAALMQRLAELTTRFAQNLLADEANYRLMLRSEDELAGLPGFVRAAAR